MKYYKHYKNKPYKYLGIVKHSETLEDLVLYECLYDNPTARIWVRPKDMFFSDIEADGQCVKRFRPIEFQYQSLEAFDPQTIAVIQQLAKDVFRQWDSEKFLQKISKMRNVIINLAFADGQAIGFKVGYETSPDCFYSWLGGVSEGFRGLGVAQALMKAQHDLCRSRGYQKVTTKTMNEHHSMLLLNLKNGFLIKGTEQKNQSAELKIILEKNL